MTMRRFVLTGAPGVGKTTIADVLRARGHTVVREAATDVIARGQEGDGFVDAVLALQLERQLAAAGEIQVYDRSPLCTLALARYLGVPASAALTREAQRAAGLFEAVFLVRPLGFVTPTEARRISYPDSLRFEAVHEQVYAEYGCPLIDVPKAPLADRVALVERYLLVRR
jgi:predicted ATPase